MKTVSALFQITAIVVFVQLLLGGLVTFNFISPIIHIVTGVAVLILVILTLIAVLRSKSKLRALRGMSIGLVVLVLIQIFLGFATLGSGSSVLAWIHFTVALGIYGMAVAGSVISSFLGRMEKYQKPQGGATPQLDNPGS